MHRSIGEGNEFAYRNPDIYQANRRAELADEALLKRNTGEVILDAAGIKRARLNGIEVSQSVGMPMAILEEVGLNADHACSVTIQHVDENKSISAADNGFIVAPEGSGLSCQMSMAISTAVARVLKDGKVDVQEVKILQEILDTAPSPTRSSKICAPTKSI
ncbi:MAG: hypothetical protein ACOYNL_07105 [Rickettsiales bacterium]